MGLVLICCCIQVAHAQSIPNTTITTIDGDSIELNQYHGKKLIIMVLPVTHSEADSLALLKIDSTYQQFKDSLNFIGVISYEDGYADSLQAVLKDWYRNTLHLGFTITTGLYTHTNSGEQQAPVFQWLSTEALNGHFGTGIHTFGQKFILNENGEMNAMLDETTRLTPRLLQAILSPGSTGN